MTCDKTTGSLHVVGGNRIKIGIKFQRCWVFCRVNLFAQVRIGTKPHENQFKLEIASLILWQ